MKHPNILLAVLVFFTAVLAPGLVRAQSCDTHYEVIATLYPPQFGVPAVWDARYGSFDNMTQLVSGVTRDGGTVLGLGRRISKTDFKPLDIVLVELNRRGRALMEKPRPAKDSEEPVKLIAIRDGYISVSNIAGNAVKNRSEKQVNVAWYSKDADFRRNLVLRDDVYDYETFGVLSASEGGGFVVLLHAMNRNNDADQHGVLMRFTPEGKQVWRRAYRVGVLNQLNGVVPIDDKNYLAMGHIRLDDGRMAGWVLKLAYDGTILWQRTYPRGSFSTLHHAAMSSETSSEGPGFILSGESMPVGGELHATWILAIDATGEPRWQRYYRRPDYDLASAGVRTEEDGRISVLINAKNKDSVDGRSHVRLLTLSRRGIMVADESYIEGIQAHATDFFGGWNGERILTATIESDGKADAGPMGPPLPSQESSAAPVRPQPVQEGWVLVANALDPYIDPCDTRRRN